jgi:hypothetical protein
MRERARLEAAKGRASAPMRPKPTAAAKRPGQPVAEQPAPGPRQKPLVW